VSHYSEGRDLSTNNEKITWALDTLLQGLSPYVESELKTVFQDRWADTARESFRKDRGQAILHGDTLKWDVHSVLTVMWDQWNRVFRHKLGFLERSLVSELREYRNKWAHQTNFDFDDEYRILDSVERLLNSVNSEYAENIKKSKKDLLRLRFSEEARAVYRKAQVKKRKWQDLVIYGACCASITFVIFQQFGAEAWFFAIFNVFVFAYLGY